jgi:hypothetical protein
VGHCGNTRPTRSAPNHRRPAPSAAGQDQSRHGPRLAALPYDLIWATTWMDDANETIAPRIGLPQLAVLIWPEPTDTDEHDERNGLHWKTRTLVDWAAGPHSPGSTGSPTPTEPGCQHITQDTPCFIESTRLGLTDADYATLKVWLTGLVTRRMVGPEAPTQVTRRDTHEDSISRNSLRHPQLPDRPSMVRHRLNIFSVKPAPAARSYALTRPRHRTGTPSRPTQGTGSPKLADTNGLEKSPRSRKPAAHPRQALTAADPTPAHKPDRPPRVARLRFSRVAGRESP